MRGSCCRKMFFFSIVHLTFPQTIGKLKVVGKTWHYLMIAVIVSIGAPSAFSATDPGSSPKPEPSPIQRSDSILDDPGFDPKLPWYQSTKPSWSLHFKAGINGFPVKSGNGNLYLIGFEWLIPEQRYGIFGVGADLGFLSLKAPLSTLSTSSPLNPFLGGQIRYQLKLLNNQWLVPTATLNYDYYRLKNSVASPAYASGAQIGWSAGLFISLSGIDPITARGAYQSLGLTKSYLTLEAFQTKFKNSVFQMESRFYLIGLRAEFE